MTSVLGKRPAPIPSTTHYFQPTIQVSTAVSSRSAHTYHKESHHNHTNTNKIWNTRRRVRKWMKEPMKMGSMTIQKWKLAEQQDFTEEDVSGIPDDTPQAQTFYSLCDDRGRRRTAIPLTRGARTIIGEAVPELPPIYDKKVWISQKKLKQKEEAAAAKEAAAAAAAALANGESPPANIPIKIEGETGVIGADGIATASSSPAPSPAPTAADVVSSAAADGDDDLSSSSSSSDSEMDDEMDDEMNDGPDPSPTVEEEGMKPPSSPTRDDTPSANATAAADEDNSLPAMPSMPTTSSQPADDAAATDDAADAAAAAASVDASSLLPASSASPDDDDPSNSDGMLTAPPASAELSEGILDEAPVEETAEDNTATVTMEE